MNQQDRILHIRLSALEQFEMCTMDWVSVLKCNDVFALWQGGANFSRSHHWVLELWTRKTMEASSDVVLPLLCNERIYGWVFQARGAVNLFRFCHLVCFVYRRCLQNGNVL